MVAAYFDEAYHVGAIPRNRLLDGDVTWLRARLGIDDPTLTEKELSVLAFVACHRLLKCYDPDSREARYLSDWAEAAAGYFEALGVEWRLYTLDRLHELGYVANTVQHLRATLPE